MSELELSIVLPAYREARALETFLPKLIEEAGKLTPSFEVLVVDTHEPVDDTKDVAEKAGARHIFRTGGNTYGDAVRSGITASRGRLVLFMDGDGSHNPMELPKLWDARNKADIVIGSRYVKGGQTENPAILIWMSQVVNQIYRFAFRLPVKDVSNSLRLYRGEQLRALELKSSNFDIVEEILLRLVCGQAQATVTEVPVTFERRKAGESKRNLMAFAFSYLHSIRKMLEFKRSEQRKMHAARKG
jgi:dolichol-phosphate mannosyltransferase